MLKINFEFRKGIFFIRLIGNLNDNSYKDEDIQIENLIVDNKFKYVVINTNFLKRIDLDGLKYLTEIVHLIRINESNLVICDKFNIFSKLLNDNIPSIESEIDVL